MNVKDFLNEMKEQKEYLYSDDGNYYNSLYTLPLYDNLEDESEVELPISFSVDDNGKIISAEFEDRDIFYDENGKAMNVIYKK